MFAVATIWISGGPTPAYANRIAIVVNGTAITSLDIDRRIKLLRLQRARGKLKEKAQEQLIEEAIKMTEVGRLRAAVSDARVNQSFARFAKGNKMSTKQMSQMLRQAGVGADHFKEFIRVQMSWPRVVEARYSSGGRMSTEDLVSKMLERGGVKPTTTEYILQQVIFVVPKAKRNAILSARKREAESMRQRFVDCNSTREFAKGLKDVSVRDLGRVMQPALPGDWKALVEKTSEGKTTGTKVTDRGVEFIAVCSAKEVSDDLAAEMVIRSELAKEPSGNSANSDKYMKELREKARVTYK
ncbi:MAG: peptidylprolyl isomerase [Hyphomicrobiales bacterium]|nr:peptidylprolyl isomerase [Hyphomicrobiales bacterium]MCP4997478.1 peptidylprolyl isomerase [Hyphomicrobiales bacterium]